MSRDEYVRRLLLAGAVAVGAALVVRGLPRLADVALLLFTGLLFAVVVHGLAAWVGDRTPLPRQVAALGTFFLVLGIVGAAVWWSGPRMADQFGRLAERLPEIVDGAVDSVRETEWGATLLDQVASRTREGGASGILGGVTTIFSTVSGAFTGVLVVLFVAIFVSYDPYLYRDAVLSLLPEGERRERVRRLFHELARTLRLWMKARLVSMGVVGLLTGIALAVAGLPLAFALALIAAVLAFIPFVGPLLSSVPAILIGFGEGGVRTALLVAGIYSAVQLVESYMIDPVIEKRMVSLPPAFVIAAQIVMGALFGLLGVFLATPAAVVSVVLVQQLYLRDQLDQEPKPLGT